MRATACDACGSFGTNDPQRPDFASQREETLPKGWFSLHIYRHDPTIKPGESGDYATAQVCSRKCAADWITEKL